MKRFAALVFLVVASLSAAALAVPVPAAPRAPLSAQQQAVLTSFLRALAAQRYADAFALLSDDEKKYFGNARNYASIFQADGLRLLRFRPLGANPDPPRGALALVSEDVAFIDRAHQAQGTATVRVAYGLLNVGTGIRIKDPYHPWRAFAPPAASAESDQLQVVVQKVSFFTGRVDVMLTFVNHGASPITLLPYGRTVLRDDRGGVYHPIEMLVPSLTDLRLRRGIVLEPNTEYTGTMTFATPNRFTPRTLGLTVAPALRDGADAPLSLDLPTLNVPS